MILFDQRDGMLTLTFPSRLRHDEFKIGLQRLMETCNDVDLQGGKLVIIADVRVAEVPSATERRLVGEAIRANDNCLRRILCGWAVVTDSLLHRGVITAISWISPSPCPLSTFSSVSRAEAWAQRQLSGVGSSSSSS